MFKYYIDSFFAAVEIKYELYNPTILSIEVLVLEKRLDQNLFYLRDAPLEESRFPFDMTSKPLMPGDPVPINEKKVGLVYIFNMLLWHLNILDRIMLLFLGFCYT